MDINIQKQKCCKCKNFLSFDQFNKSVNQPNGLHRNCKPCRKQERQNCKEHISEKNKKYYLENNEKLLKQNAEYRSINIISINKQRKEYRDREDVKIAIQKKNMEYLPIRNKNTKERRKTDKDFQLTEILRSKYHKMIKGNDTSYIKIIGCGVETFKKWIEFQFEKDMNWENQGKYWHLDHILPINQFNFNNKSEIQTCFNWTNIQPLRSYENREKSDKIILHYYMNLIVNVNRFIKKTKSNFEGYQRINESLIWLREKLRYGKNPVDEL